MSSRISTSSGPPPPWEDSEWWKVGLVFLGVTLLALLLLAAFLTLPWWWLSAWSWFQGGHLMDDFWSSLAIGALSLVALAAAWYGLGQCIGRDHPLLHPWQSLGALIGFGQGKPWID